MHKFYTFIALLLFSVVSVPLKAFADGAVPVGANSLVATLPTTEGQIYAPSNNTKGMYLRTCTILAQATNITGGIAAEVFYGTSTSANTAILFAAAYNNTWVQQTMPYQLYVPAGNGLYGVVTNTTGAGGAVYCTFDLVN